MSISKMIQDMSSIDFFKEGKNVDTFVGRPFALDYERASILICDAWKMKVGGIPQGSFLLAFYENEANVKEALLLRAIKPTSLPTENDVISSMIEYYKDNAGSSNSGAKLDDFTRYEYSFSGIECRILGTFYMNDAEEIEFGADVENFYSSHNYKVYKPTGAVLKYIANLRDGNSIAGGRSDEQIGKVRYSSSRRFQNALADVPVFISPGDFLGKRTALFGMTRTGKSNTVKKIIQSTVKISAKAKPLENAADSANGMQDPLDEKGNPVFAVGQIIFDINGEYANPNMQDEGTAIYEMYQNQTIRYSTNEKPGFKVMKVNFYKDVNAGMGMIRGHLQNESGDYVKGFLAIDFDMPEKDDFSGKTRFDRKVAAYKCMLYAAKFNGGESEIVKFKGNQVLNKMVKPDGSINPEKGITLEQACFWFSRIWSNYNDKYFEEYRDKNGHEWADEDLKSLMIMLTRKKAGSENISVSGYVKIRDLRDYHSPTNTHPYDEEILEHIRSGKIIIIDLSQGAPDIQRLYSERICQKIFADSMDRFIKNQPNNFIQYYFEEAHNLFPKRDEKDLSQIYNRIAKEGAKLNLGIIYATQEVSSISSNILKNTQNWFIAHLNNNDELRELKKYYDFGDFVDSLIRFSSSNDKGFVRMKTYSNPFVVPVQIDRFTARD